MKEIVEVLESTYLWVQERCSRIDFEELEREIDTLQDRGDFETLFKTRELLPQFKQAVDAFSR